MRPRERKKASNTMIVHGFGKRPTYCCTLRMTYKIWYPLLKDSLLAITHRTNEFFDALNLCIYRYDTPAIFKQRNSNGDLLGMYLLNETSKLVEIICITPDIPCIMKMGLNIFDTVQKCQKDNDSAFIAWITKTPTSKLCASHIKNRLNFFRLQTIRITARS